ncbi:adenylate/guanylate cyclase domain-containing protein [Burkholderia ubonensis]|uniref:adenylate/guanylate cyclase domain-containing protein n=1 Tax=Burkholderia ubonensis TaxID=101571 RepID=UPI0009B44E2D|nr:adenylate/guanylate cyclase domain-containing protein [Burkholderia ubonensis]
MTLHEDLLNKVTELTAENWAEIPSGCTIPDLDNLNYLNSGVNLYATILYADIHGSTPLVDSTDSQLAAEYYKAFLHCASQIIRNQTGEIQAYDGDRVMGVFLGENHANRAINSALMINFSISSIINPTFSNQYGDSHKKLQHTVGIDTGPVMATKVGVRAAGELAWIGAPANYAAKLNSFNGLDPAYPTRITTRTFELLPDNLKIDINRNNMWDGPYNNLKKIDHYRCNYWMTFQ